MGAILTTLLGGLLALAGGLVGIALSDRRERHRWRRDSQLQANAALLSGLQLVIRRMINMAYVGPPESLDQTSSVVMAFNEALVVWNNARYAAMFEYLRSARRQAGLPDMELTSIWTWDRDHAAT
jgi:hypothetical protein